MSLALLDMQSGYIPKVTSKKASMDGAPRFMSPPARKACHVCGAQFVPTVGPGGSEKFCATTLTPYLDLRAVREAPFIAVWNRRMSWLDLQAAVVNPVVNQWASLYPE